MDQVVAFISAVMNLGVFIKDGEFLTRKTVLHGVN
jgi:hypothetical protein